MKSVKQHELEHEKQISKRFGQTAGSHTQRDSFSRANSIVHISRSSTPINDSFGTRKLSNSKSQAKVNQNDLSDGEDGWIRAMRERIDDILKTPAVEDIGSIKTPTYDELLAKDDLIDKKIKQLQLKSTGAVSLISFIYLDQIFY